MADPDLLTHTSITSRKGGPTTGRMNEPMFVARICAGVTGAHELSRIGVPSASVLPSAEVFTVSKRYSTRGRSSTTDRPPLRRKVSKKARPSATVSPLPGA